MTRWIGCNELRAANPKLPDCCDDDGCCEHDGESGDDCDNGHCSDSRCKQARWVHNVEGERVLEYDPDEVWIDVCCTLRAALGWLDKDEVDKAVENVLVKEIAAQPSA